MRRILKAAFLLGGLSLPAVASAEMSFDECAALNKGETRTYWQTFTAANKQVFRNTLEVTATGTVERGESANVRQTIEIPLGFSGPLTTFTQTDELATGTVERTESVTDFGVDLASVLSASGQSKYEQTVRYRKNGSEWKDGPSRTVQFTMRDSNPVVLGRCSIDTVLFEIASVDKNGRVNKTFRRIVYAPAAKITVANSDFYGADEVVYRKITDLEAKK
jgi:hypothetical protein